MVGSKIKSVPISQIQESKPDQSKPDHIEVWEDLVKIKSLILSLFICSTTSLAGYFIAPNQAPKPLFFGLIGALIGFILCSMIIKPKRLIHEVTREDS